MRKLQNLFYIQRSATLALLPSQQRYVWLFNVTIRQAWDIDQLLDCARRHIPFQRIRFCFLRFFWSCRSSDRIHEWSILNEQVCYCAICFQKRRQRRKTRVTSWTFTSCSGKKKHANCFRSNWGKCCTAAGSSIWLCPLSKLPSHFDLRVE